MVINVATMRLREKFICGLQAGLETRRRRQASPTAVITTSIALMPTNGTMIPPTP
jgi:hypothetical protein